VATIERETMAFVQIIEYTTKKPDEIKRIDEEWAAATEGRRTATRVLTCRDRSNPDRYVVIVEFPSYEVAMQNSEMPETSEAADKMQALTDAPPTFTDLDVVDEFS